MKQFFLIFVAIVAISALPLEQTGNLYEETTRAPNQKTLAEWIADLERKLQIVRENMENRGTHFGNNIDVERLKENIKYSQNAQKQVKEAQFMTLLIIGIIKYQRGKTEAEGYDEALNMFIRNYGRNNIANNRECFVLELQKFDPTSKLVENFDASAMTISAKECERRIDARGFVNFIGMIEEKTGPFPTFTCGHLTVDEIQRLGMTAVVLESEENEELKREEKEKFMTELRVKINGIFDCVLESL